jgi:hypothetical protein
MYSEISLRNSHREPTENTRFFHQKLVVEIIIVLSFQRGLKEGT